MLALFTSSFLFSIKGLLYISIIALLIWLLQDYPHWKSKEKNSKGETTIKETASKTETSNLSLAHYILVSPFAALYIIGRGTIDMIRYTLYYIVWSCENSLPYIDDWLFEFVTVSLPERYTQTEIWWINRGKPASIRFKAYVRQSVIPYVIQYTEVCFVGLYKFGCGLQSLTIEIVGAWRQFIQRHDWERLALDLSDIAYNRVWIPVYWSVTKSYRLFTLAYIGIRASLVSILDDIQWIFTAVIPNLYYYITSTKIAQLSGLGFMYTVNQIKWLCVKIQECVLVPTVGRMLTWTIRCIDRLVEMMEHRSMHEKLIQLYCILAPQFVWQMIELCSFMDTMKSGSFQFYAEIIYPAYQLFQKQMMPHLQVLYEKMRQFVIGCIYPIWQRVYPYLNRLVYLFYIYIMVPTYSKIQHMLFMMRTPKLVWIIYSRVYNSIATIAWNLYYFVQNWLIRQAPVLSKMIQNSYFIVIHSCDWQSLYNDSHIIVTQFYDWISKQGNLMYESFERTLTIWVQEQANDKKL